MRASCSGPEGLDGVERVVLPGVGAAPSAVEALTVARAVGAAARVGRRRPPAARPVPRRAAPAVGLGRGAGTGAGPHRGPMPRLSGAGGRGTRARSRTSAGTRSARESAAFDAYFVHGYWLDADPAAVVGWTEVDGFRFPSLLRAGALTGTQFHPEKSGPTGRALLAAFARGALDARPVEAAAWS